MSRQSRPTFLKTKVLIHTSTSQLCTFPAAGNGNVSSTLDRTEGVFSRHLQSSLKSILVSTLIKYELMTVTISCHLLVTFDPESWNN